MINKTKIETIFLYTAVFSLCGTALYFGFSGKSEAPKRSNYNNEKQIPVEPYTFAELRDGNNDGLEDEIFYRGTGYAGISSVLYYDSTQIKKDTVKNITEFQNAVPLGRVDFDYTRRFLEQENDFMFHLSKKKWDYFQKKKAQEKLEKVKKK